MVNSYASSSPLTTNYARLSGLASWKSVLACTRISLVRSDHCSVILITLNLPKIFFAFIRCLSKRPLFLIYSQTFLMCQVLESMHAEHGDRIGGGGGRASAGPAVAARPPTRTAETAAAGDKRACDQGGGGPRRRGAAVASARLFGEADDADISAAATDTGPALHKWNRCPVRQLSEKGQGIICLSSSIWKQRFYSLQKSKMYRRGTTKDTNVSL